MLDSITETTKRISVNPRRMLLYGFLGILCIARTIESAPLEIGNDSSRHSSTGTLSSGSKKGQDEEVGNPSELAWQAWLLVDGHPGSQPSGILDSASLLRRITPKSIFIAPKRTDCPEGYQDDTMSRCVKDVNIDHQAQMGFLVERLKAIYGNVGKPQASASASSSSSSGSSSSIASGPLHLNIPLLITGPGKPIEKTEIHEPEKPPSTVEPVKPLKIITGELAEPGSTSPHHQDAIVTVYELNEDTRDEDDTFFLGNKSTEIFNKNDTSHSKPDLVPVAEFVDNDSNVSGIVDYKIPISSDKIYNRTIEEESPNVNTDSDPSPTLVLLLSPTKVPSISMPSSTDILAHNSSLGQVIIKMENITGNLTGKEIIRLSVPESATIRPETFEDTEESVTKLPISELVVSGENVENEPGSTEAYEDENYEESTEIEDEILKHSEAGMTVTIRDSVKSVTTETPAESNDRETTGSSEISSEVSINGDFVRETTLVDFNVSKTSNSNETATTLDETSTSASNDDSKGLEIIETSLNSEDDLKNEKRDHISKIKDENQKNIEKIEEIDKEIGEIGKKIGEFEKKIEKSPELVFPASSIDDLFDKDSKIEASGEKMEIGETMIAASTNEAGQTISEPPKFEIVPSSKKRGQPFRFESASTTKIPSYQNVEGIYDYEPVPRDYPRHPAGFTDESLPVIRTIDEQRYRPEEEDQSFFGSQQQQQDYVRFPSYDRNGRPNYVRFPSEEANSIHSPNDYKDRNRRPYGQYQTNYSRGQQATKNLQGPEIRQKQSYWWVPPGWRMDRQQQQQQSQPQQNPQRSRSGVDRPRDRAPMLLRFWTRMPLVRDPSLSYQQPTYPTLGVNSRSDSRSHYAPSRRVNYYKEMSTQDLSRAFTRKSLPAIGG